MTLLALLISGLAGCDVPATAFPVDPCRVGDTFDAVSADVRCAAAGTSVEASFEWGAATILGGVRGEGWDGLGFVATGATPAGGTLSLGHRSGALGFYARDTSSVVEVGFVPSVPEVPEAPHVTLTDGDTTCDAATGAGSVTLAGLPEAWSEGGTWEMTFDGGTFTADAVSDAWSAPWPATCPMSPSAWASVRVAAACDGVERATIQFLAPASYAVELDALGQAASVSATWTEAFSATCDGGAPGALDGSLQGEDGALQLYTPVLSAARDADGAWVLEETACGACDAWVVTVEGLPEL